MANKLSLAQSERLALLAEQCAEVVVIVGKILRHGYENQNPDCPDLGTNRQLLAAELGDVGFAQELMAYAGDFDPEDAESGFRTARRNKPKYLHHQDIALLLMCQDLDAPE